MAALRTALFGAVLVLGLAPGAGPASAEVAAVVLAPARPSAGDAPVALVVDADDDDEDNVADATQVERVPGDDLLAIRVAAGSDVTLEVEGPIRLIHGGRAISGALSLRRRALPTTVHLQGTRASATAGDGRIRATAAAGGTAEVRATVIGLAFLDGSLRPLSADRDALGVSHHITNDATLPRGPAYADASSDLENIRLELFDPSLTSNRVTATLSAFGADGAVRSTLRNLVLTRPAPGLPFRSYWIRLVGDELDRTAPGIDGQVLRVALRDRVRLGYAPVAGGAELAQDLRVGRPGDEDGPKAARRGRLRVRVLRPRPGAPPVLGSTDAGALALAREQVAIASEVWLQCSIGFGRPEEADVAIVDPPAPGLLAIGDEDGLRARGGGVIRFRADGRLIGPVHTLPNAAPVETALRVKAAAERAGFHATVTENAPTDFGAGRSADVVLRTRSGAPVALEPWGESTPLTTDARQSAQLGRVDLGNGLEDFDNMTSAAGTLEERALIKALADSDPRTVDLFLINHFTSRSRQGEAFIELDGEAITNTVILDRSGIEQQRHAWTQSHELGHVLQNFPYHPDNLGPDRPWLLMDADSSLGTVTGPKRLTWDECHAVHAQSGVGATPALLERLDGRSPAPPPAAGARYDLGYPRP